MMRRSGPRLPRVDPGLLRAQVLHALGTLQAPGWIALALLGATGAALWLSHGPLAQRIRAEQAQLESARLELATMRTRPAAPGTEGDAGALLARLEAPERLPAFIEFVHERAAANSIQIDRAEYRARSDLRGRAVRYELVLPARGEYPKLRNWIESVLHAHPMAALDEWSMRRGADGSPQLEARVRLSYYLRSGR